MNYPRELVLLDDVSITAAGALTFRSPLPQWCANPRFQLVVTDLTDDGGGTPRMHMILQHAIDSAKPELLYDGFEVGADGSFPAYCEELTTRNPFPLIRANVLVFDNLTSLTAKLVAFFDKP